MSQAARSAAPATIASLERLLELLHIRFGMSRAMARASETQAETLISDACARAAGLPLPDVPVAFDATIAGVSTTTTTAAAATTSASTTSDDALTSSRITAFDAQCEQALLSAMRLFIDAADSYARVRAASGAVRSLARAALVAEQLRQSGLRLVGLSSAAARRLMINHGARGDACVRDACARTQARSMYHWLLRARTALMIAQTGWQQRINKQ
jgi:hypothetical protein